jgi:muramoyltetrapeptide carboxypeptidase
MIVLPDYLKKGDTIGIVAPASYMAFEKMETCIETLDSWGYKVELGKTTHSSSNNYFSGTDEERLQDVQRMLDSKKINAILCARGGYGTSRIIDRFDFKKFKKHPKWIIGFSDITVLHCHLYSKFHISSIHAPMAAAFNEGEFNNTYIQSLKKTIKGMPAEYESSGSEYNKPGEAQGELVGGNLTLIAHLIGTRSDINTKDRILFLEDVGEYLYNIDRMLLQLKRSGKLKKLAGLVIGGFTDSKDTERPFGKSAYETIYEHVKEYDYPVSFNFPVSHDKENYALKIGANYTLKVSADKTELFE